MFRAAEKAWLALSAPHCRLRLLVLHISFQSKLPLPLSSLFVCFLLMSVLLSQRNFVEEKLGVKYTEGRKTEFAKSYRESGPASPMFFILSPGVDPLKDVESLGIIVGTYTEI